MNKCCGKNCTDRLAHLKFARKLQFVKKKTTTVSVKHNKMRNAYTALQKACICVTTSRSRNRTLLFPWWNSG